MTQTYTEHRKDNDYMAKIYAMQDESEKRKHLPARERALLAKRVEKAFNAVYGDTWKD